jgi:hypothetical protein
MASQYCHRPVRGSGKRRTWLTADGFRAIAVAVVLLASVMGATADHVAAQGVPSAASRPSKSSPRSHPQPTNLAVLDSGYGPTAAQKTAMAAASRLAQAGGQPAVVDELTSETQQILAEPHGGFALASDPNPVRAQHGGAYTPPPVRTAG